MSKPLKSHYLVVTTARQIVPINPPNGFISLDLAETAAFQYLRKHEQVNEVQVVKTVATIARFNKD